MVEGMKKLAHKAHVITPNITEACLLADIDYIDLSSASVEKAASVSCEIMQTLSTLYVNTDIIITGIVCKDNILTLAKKKNSDEISITENSLLPISFPGTGDLFSSLFLARTLAGDNIFDASKYATNQTTSAVKFSQGTDEEIRNGIILEKFLNENNF